MISTIALAKHGRAQILQLRVLCRIPADAEEETEAGEIIPASFASGTGDLMALDGGIIYDRGGNLVIAKADWPAAMIEQTPVEILLSAWSLMAGMAVLAEPQSWKTYNVENVSGSENPTFTEVRLAIGPANN